MSANALCLQCGRSLPADAPRGVCPGCLLGLLDTEESNSATQLSDPQPGAPPATQPSTPAPHPACGHPLPSDGRGAGGEGTRSFGDYELLEEIARGGMGIVYKARQKNLNRLVAVKMILSGQFAGKQAAQRFRGEAAAAGVLQHPHIVAIHEIGMHEGQHFFSMDFVEGQNLTQLVGNRPLPAHHAARYVKQIAEAIHYAHQQGILHRDLKPSNVLIDAANDQPRVTDFGLAKRFSDSSLVTEHSSLTLTGQVLGSPNFMPPEQASGARGKVGRPSDVYGLGGILYFLLTARAPFQGETLQTTIHQALHNEPIAPRLLNASAPRDLETICLKCLEKEPTKRYASAQELADELNRFLNDEPIHARPVTRAERTWRWCRRKPALAASLAAMLVLALIISIGSPIAAVRINQARQLAEANELKARRNLYAAHMTQAFTAFEQGHLGRTRELIGRYEPGGSRRKEAQILSPALISLQSLTNNQRLATSASTDFRGWEWHYLKAQTRGEQLATVGSFSNSVTCVAFSPDGKLIAAGDGDGQVSLWRASDRRRIVKFSCEPWAVCMAFSPDGKTLTIGGKEAVELWDVSTQTKRGSLPAQQRASGANGGALAFLPDGSHLAVGDHTGRLRVWDLESRKAVDLVGHRDGVGCLSFSPDGKSLASSSLDGTVKIWNWRRPAIQSVLTNFTSPPTAVAFSPDGLTLAAAEWDAGAMILDARTGQLLFALTNHLEWITSLAFLPDGKKLVTASADHSLKVWDTKNGRELATLRGHGDEVACLSVSPDGQRIVTGGKEGSVMLWSTEAGPSEDECTSLLHHADWSAISPDGSKLLTLHGTTNLIYRLWNTAEAKVPTARPFPLPRPTLIALSHEGHLAAAATTNGMVQLWNPQAQVLGRQFNCGLAWIRQIRFSPQRETLAVVQRSAIHFFNTATGKEAATIPNRDRKEKIVGFSPHGDLVVIRNMEENIAEIWNLDRQQQTLVLRGHQAYIADAAFSPDGRVIATAGLDAKLKLWNAATGECFDTLTGQMNAFNAVCFSPDGTRLAAIGSILKIWDTATRQEVANLKGQKKVIGALQFSPSGEAIIGVGYDSGTTEIWRAASVTEDDLPGSAKILKGNTP